MVSALVLVGLAVLQLPRHAETPGGDPGCDAQGQPLYRRGSRNAEVVKALGMYREVVERWGDYNREALKLQSEMARNTSWLSGGTRSPARSSRC